MSKWNRTKLSEVLEVIHGYAFPSEGMSDQLTGRPIIVNIGNFDYRGGFRFGVTRTREFVGDYPEQFELEPRDLLIAMTCQTPGGEILGLPGFVPDDGRIYLHNQRIGKVLIDPDRLNSRFAYYCFLSPAVNRQLVATASGTKILHTAPSRIGAVEVDLPALSIQRAIADVLGALDDKITVNNRISRTALDLADSIFDSLVSSVEMGTRTFGSVASVFGGGTPRTSEPDYWHGDIAWTTPSDVTVLHSPYLFQTERTISESGLANCASQLYPTGSIFMTSRATIGAFAIPQLPAAVNQGFIVVVPPSPEMRWWLFHEMRSRVDEMLSLANGSTFLELSRSNFKHMRVRLAPDEVVQEFHNKVDSLHCKAAMSELESSTLRKIRDSLLPKLMSGEIRVREAERVVEDAT